MSKDKNRRDLPEKPSQTLELLDIPPSARKLYRLMYALAGSGVCYAKKKTLAVKMGTSERYVRKLIRHLKDAGAIKEHARNYGTAVYTFPALPKPKYVEKAVPREFRRSSASVPVPVPQEFRGSSPIIGDTNVGLTSPNGEGEMEDGGMETLPKSSPSRGGGLHVRCAHEEEEDARCARVDCPDDDGDEDNAHPKGGVVVPLKPHERAVAHLLDLFERVGEREDTILPWVEAHCRPSMLSKAREAYRLMLRMVDMDDGPSMDAWDTGAKAVAMLLDMGSPSGTQKAMRRWHAKVVKEYQAAVGHGEYDEIDEAQEG